MIRVTVELIPGGVGEPLELCSCTITNNLSDTLRTNGRRGSYRYSFFSRKNRIYREGSISNFPRKSNSAWSLLARCLKDAGIK